MRKPSSGLPIFHFSYHKCLTVYYRRVLSGLFADSRLARSVKRALGNPCGYTHFNSLVGDFYRNSRKYRACSVNNQLIDFAKLGGYRATHFIRDPRDLVVSGYFYHRRGAEAWCREPSSEENWAVVNGTLPRDLPEGQSFSGYLSSCSEEDGLIAEIEFRKKHFSAMERWNYSNPDCLELRYEEVFGNERTTFEKIFLHYGLNEREISRGLVLAERYSAGRAPGESHVRDPAPGQWRKHFTPKVADAFQSHYPTILSTLGY